MKKISKKPEIRFAGFEDEWVKKKFDDVFDMISNNTLSRDALNSESGVAKNIHYGDVLTKVGEYVDVSNTKLPFISDPDITTKLIRSYLKDGDIVIADTAEDETVGKCTEVIGVEEMPIIAGLHTMPCRPKEKYAPKYMGYYLNSNAYHDNLFPLMQGVKVTSISRTGVKETEVILSTEFDEQEMIGEHLSSLDDMIALETAKYEKLVIIKKAMLEKMFPKEGCDVPELRFGGYTGAWGERQLQQVADKVNEKNTHLTFKETFTNSAEYGVISQRDFFDHDITNASNIGGYYVVQNNDFVYNPRISSIAPVGPVNRNKLDRCGVISPLYTVFRPHDIDYAFLEQFFKTRRWHSFMYFNGDTGTRFDRFSIKTELFFKLPVPYPEIEEQKLIGVYLEDLDKSISLQQQKVNKLKNIKSACMEKMFV